MSRQQSSELKRVGERVSAAMSALFTGQVLVQMEIKCTGHVARLVGTPALFRVSQRESTIENDGIGFPQERFCFDQHLVHD